MKKFIMMALLASSLSAFVIANDFSFSEGSKDLKIVHVLSATNEELNSFMQGQNSNIIVQFSENTLIPLHLFLKGDVVNLIEQDDVLQLNIKETFYVRLIEGEYQFSLNLIDWKSFLEFLTGTASVALSVQEGQMMITMGTEANLRP